MQIFEISFRNVKKNEAIEELIRKKAAKLEQVCSDLIACRIAVERPQQHQRSGNPYRVRIDMNVPGNEFAVTRESSEGEIHDPLAKILGVASNAARRKLREYAKRQSQSKIVQGMNSSAPVNREYEVRLYDYCDRPIAHDFWIL